MGDRSHVKLYSELLAFLEQRGQTLLDHGSAERGLSKNDTREFLNVLHVNGVQVLGIELWRGTPGEHRIDVTEIWYSTVKDLDSCHTDALDYLVRVNAGANDVFTVQFR